MRCVQLREHRGLQGLRRTSWPSHFTALDLVPINHRDHSSLYRLDLQWQSCFTNQKLLVCSNWNQAVFSDSVTGAAHVGWNSLLLNLPACMWDKKNKRRWLFSGEVHTHQSAVIHAVLWGISFRLEKNGTFTRQNSMLWSFSEYFKAHFTDSVKNNN